MTERTLRHATGVLALAGAAVTGYLLYVRQSGIALACSSDGCETVQASHYAEVLGVPVAGLGLAGFLGLVVTALVAGQKARMAQVTLALSAFLFSAYLLYVQLAVIGAVCEWCLLTDALTTAISTLALLRLRIETNAQGSEPSYRLSARAPSAPRRQGGTKSRRGLA